jgi:multidrug resistance efflux pump
MEFFRKSALENRYQQEEDAEIVRVSPPGTWFLLLLIVMLLATTCLFLALAPQNSSRSVPVMRYSSSSQQILSPVRGTLNGIYIRANEFVRSGQPIAEISARDSTTLVYSIPSGRVVGVSARRGDAVARGDLLVNIQIEDQLIVFLTPQEHRNMTVGHKATLTVNNQKEIVYSVLVTVNHISPNPVDTDILPTELTAGNGDQFAYPAQLQPTGEDSERIHKYSSVMQFSFRATFAAPNEPFLLKLYHRYTTGMTR